MPRRQVKTSSRSIILLQTSHSLKTALIGKFYSLDYYLVYYGPINWNCLALSRDRNMFLLTLRTEVGPYINKLTT